MRRGEIKKFIASKSKTFAAFCFCFLFGVGIISAFELKISWLALYIFLLAIGVLIIYYWDDVVKRFWLAGVLAFLLGGIRYSLAFPTDTPINIHTHAGNKGEIIGDIVDEPDVRTDGVRYTVAAREFDGQEVRGKIYVKYNLYPRFSYGDIVKVNCKLERPQPFEDKNNGIIFRYDLYLARYGIFAICQNPFIERVGTGQGSDIFRMILRFKSSFAVRITSLWPEPDASFMAGLLYGYRGGLGTLNELFSRTGVTHIVAISGFNITIIATILINFCIYLYIPRQKAFWIIATGIVLFVIFTGASASVVRAGIMGIIALLAKFVGRVARVGNVMMLAAVVMVVHNPLVLISDAGFQLSFLSTLGLVYLGPWFVRPLARVPALFGVRESFQSTLAAITATLPLILYQFGRLSIVAPIVNVLILWLIPWLMLIGVAAVAASFIFAPLAHFVAGVAWVGLEYIIFIVRWFAHLPFAALDIRVSGWVMAAMYCGMLYIICLKKSKF